MTSSRTSASVRSVNLDGTAIGGVGFSMTEVLKSHLTTSTDVNQQTEFLKGKSCQSLVTTFIHKQTDSAPIISLQRTDLA